MPFISFPKSIQERIISASLNSSMLMNFLMGIYTLIYIQTMYKYLSRKSEKENRRGGRVVLSAISVLYLITLMQFAVQWYSLNVDVVVDGETREGVFDATVGGTPQWIATLDDFLTYSAIIVSDGLLIWRCFNVWGRSFRVIFLPLLLTIAEIGLFAAVMALEIIFTQLSNDSNNNIFNNVSSALAYVSLVTTLLTTFLIGYRIHSSSRQSTAGGFSGSKKVFAHIVKVVVESSAVYALLLLLYAIVLQDPAANSLKSRVADAGFYVQTMLVVASGMAPTVLVARIAMTSSNESVSSAGDNTHVSGLWFGSRHQTAGRSQTGSASESSMRDVHVGDEEFAPAVPDKVNGNPRENGGESKFVC